MDKKKRFYQYIVEDLLNLCVIDYIDHHVLHEHTYVADISFPNEDGTFGSKFKYELITIFNFYHLTMHSNPIKCYLIKKYGCINSRERDAISEVVGHLIACKIFDKLGIKYTKCDYDLYDYITINASIAMSISKLKHDFVEEEE